MFGKKVLAVDWDKIELRVLDVSLGMKGPRVVGGFSTRWPADIWNRDAEGIGAFLRQALRDHGIRTRTAVAAVARTQAILKSVKFPPVPDEEVAGVVHFQVVKELSFPIHEAAVDHVVTTREDGLASGALVAAARNEAVDRTQQIFQAAGLKLLQLGLRPFASHRAFRAALGDDLAAVIMLVDLGAELAELTIARGDELLFSRVVNLAGYAIRTSEATGILERVAVDHTDQDARYENFLNEAHRTVQGYRAQPDAEPIECIYLANGSGTHDELRERLGGALRVPVEPFDPTAAVACAPGVDLAASRFTAAIGMALDASRGGRAPFDFLNPKKQRVKRNPHKRLAVIGAAAAAIIIYFVVTSVGKQMAAKRKQLDEIQRQVRLLKGQHEDMMLVDRYIAHATHVVQGEVNWLETLRDLSDGLFPPAEQAVCRNAAFTSSKLGKLSRFRKYVSDTLKSEKYKKVKDPAVWLFAPQSEAPPVAGRISLRGFATQPNVIDTFREDLFARKIYRAHPRAIPPITSGREQRYQYSFDLTIDVYRPKETGKQARKTVSAAPLEGDRS